ncbi:Holliday junction resolvase RuvX [Candidatus Desulfofervidus auxilii]|uniref:Holliday junction resolvase RuvX n=1 Tax=Desulfofervidus auxilii TaxID=1621989 RepID=UPI0024810C84|nr:Holliday junction resolvase RuvX [Candidatus Desulfofervidus auxilii]
MLALDIGTERIGLAITDELGLIAQPLTVIKRKNDAQALQEIKKIIKQQKVKKIVVGMPYDAQGKIGTMGKKVMAFAEKLKAIIDVPLIFWDESFTTTEAETVLLKADLSRRHRKKVVDKLAAALILESFLKAIHEK